MRSRERGFLLIVAVVLIVLGAVMALAITLMVGGGTLSGTDQQSSAQAFFAAESGLERAFYGQSHAVACNALSYTSAVGTGSYTTSATLYNPVVPATLSAGIGATDTVVPLSTNTGYAPFGRVQIDSEQINYAALGTTAAQCTPVSPPCLTGVERGADASFATSHTAGATVAHNMCLVTSDGTVGSDAWRRLQGTRLPANILPPSANANFNSDTTNTASCVGTPLDASGCPTAGCWPTGWALCGTSTAGVTYQAWNDTAGPDGSRAAFAQKASNGTSTATNAGNFNFTPAITVTAPVTMNLTFDYNALCVGGSCNSGSEMTLTFSLSNGVTTWTSATFSTPITNGWRTATTTIAITGSGTVSISQLGFAMKLKPGQAKNGYLDNLYLDNSATPNFRLLLWRNNFP